MISEVPVIAEDVIATLADTVAGQSLVIDGVPALRVGWGKVTPVEGQYPFVGVREDLPSNIDWDGGTRACVIKACKMVPV